MDEMFKLFDNEPLITDNAFHHVANRNYTNQLSTFEGTRSAAILDYNGCQTSSVAGSILTVASSTEAPRGEWRLTSGNRPARFRPSSLAICGG
jgi:hypothetical protein